MRRKEGGEEGYCIFIRWSWKAFLMAWYLRINIMKKGKKTYSWRAEKEHSGWWELQAKEDKGESGRRGGQRGGGWGQIPSIVHFPPEVTAAEGGILGLSRCTAFFKWSCIFFMQCSPLMPTELDTQILLTLEYEPCKSLSTIFCVLSLRTVSSVSLFK